MSPAGRPDAPRPRTRGFTSPAAVEADSTAGEEGFSREEVAAGDALEGEAWDEGGTSLEEVLSVSLSESSLVSVSSSTLPSPSFLPPTLSFKASVSVLLYFSSAFDSSRDLGVHSSGMAGAESTPPTREASERLSSLAEGTEASTLVHNVDSSNASFTVSKLISLGDWALILLRN